MSIQSFSKKRELLHFLLPIFCPLYTVTEQVTLQPHGFFPCLLPNFQTHVLSFFLRLFSSHPIFLATFTFPLTTFLCSIEPLSILPCIPSFPHFYPLNLHPFARQSTNPSFKKKKNQKNINLCCFSFPCVHCTIWTLVFTSFEYNFCYMLIYEWSIIKNYIIFGF